MASPSARIDCPISALPTELLQHVFDHGTDSRVDPVDIRASQSCPPCPKPFAKTASLVCTRWRYIISRTPTLWSTSLVWDDTVDYESPTCQEEEWLTLPFTGDLDIQIAATVDTKWLAKIMNAVIPFSDRWRSFVVNQKLHGLHYVARRLSMQQDFGHLHHFSLCRPSPHPIFLETGSPMYSVLLDTFTAPITSLQIAGVAPSWGHCTFLRNLNHISMKLPQRSEMLSCLKLHDLLLSSPNLRAFRIEAFSVIDDLPEKDRSVTVVLPLLQDLVFTVYEVNSSSQGIFSLLRYPNIKRLRLGQMGPLGTSIETEGRVPLPHLYELRLQVGFEEVLDFFSQYDVTKSLRSVTIALMGGSSQPLLTSPPVRLPEVENFTIEGNAGLFSSYHILSHFDLPQLRRLGLCHPVHYAATNVVEPIDFRGPRLALPKVYQVILNNITYQTVHHLLARVDLPSLHTLNVAEHDNRHLDSRNFTDGLVEHYSDLLLNLTNLEVTVAKACHDVGRFYSFLPNVKRFKLKRRPRAQLLENWLNHITECPGAERANHLPTPYLPKLKYLELLTGDPVTPESTNWGRTLCDLIARLKNHGIHVETLHADTPMPRHDFHWLSAHTTFEFKFY